MFKKNSAERSTTDIYRDKVLTMYVGTVAW